MLDEAATAYRSALALAPGHATALSNLGAILNEQARPLEALALCEQAVAAKPDLAEAHNNLGNALQSLGRREAAERSFRSALELKPDSPHRGLRLSGCCRDYASGLALLEKRFEGGARLFLRAAPPVPSSTGAPMARPARPGTLLIWSDQGLGDSLMTMRYLPLLKQRGFARIVVYGEPALLRLFRAVPGVDHVISKQDPVPAGEFDWHCPNMSLPLAFGTRVDSIPKKAFHISEALEKQWSEKLATVAPRRIGLAWAGTKLNPKNAVRSIRLEQFAPLFGIPGLSFVSLQKGDGSEELAASRWKILDRMGECGDLLDSAALVNQLDLVITVDTAVAHLAGALGKPVWMLNRYESEWRWMLEREDSPWYRRSHFPPGTAGRLGHADRPRRRGATRA